MKIETVDKLIWTLIYGGLIAVAIGLATQRTDVPLGWVLAGAGGIVSAAGALLIYARSRMKEPQ
jgi:hypothetical protein